MSKKRLSRFDRLFKVEEGCWGETLDGKGVVLSYSFSVSLHSKHLRYPSSLRSDILWRPFFLFSPPFF